MAVSCFFSLINELVNQSICQSINQLINQLVNQLINQSNSQSTNHLLPLAAFSPASRFHGMPLMFLDWFVPVYLLVSILVLVGFGACLYFLEPGLQDAHKWSNTSVQRPPMAVARNCKEEDAKVLI